MGGQNHHGSCDNMADRPSITGQALPGNLPVDHGHYGKISHGSPCLAYDRQIILKKKQKKTTKDKMGKRRPLWEDILPLAKGYHNSLVGALLCTVMGQQGRYTYI